MDAVRGRRVVVTGASGFIGHHVADRLRARGADVHTVSAREPDALRTGIKATQPERVVHLGGFTDIGASWEAPAACFEANVTATLVLLDALRETPCTRVVFASTADVYGDVAAPFREDGPVNPLSPYAVSKWGAEKMCHLAAQTGAPPAVVVRMFNAYGPRQPVNRIVPAVILAALRGEPVEMTQGLQRREANFVEDIADGLIAAMVVDGLEGEVINLGNGNAVPIRFLAETVLQLMGNPVEARFGAKPERPVEVPVVEADMTKAQKLLGWKPTRTLEEGLVATIRWYEALSVSDR